MERFSRNIAKEISQTLQYDTEREAVIAYGLLGILQLLTNIGLTLLLGFFFGVPGQALFLSFTVSLLRRFSGGAHASSLNLCTIVGLVYSIAFAKISVYLSFHVESLWLPFVFGFSSLFVSWVTVALRAPVDSPKKPIRSAAKKQRMRRGSFSILALYTILFIVLFILGCYQLTFLSFGYSLVFGVLWQTFSLTPTGIRFLSNLNKSLEKEEVTQE